MSTPGGKSLRAWPFAPSDELLNISSTANAEEELVELIPLQRKRSGAAKQGSLA